MGGNACFSRYHPDRFWNGKDDSRPCNTEEVNAVRKTPHRAIGEQET